MFGFTETLNLHRHSSRKFQYSHTRCCIAPLALIACVFAATLTHPCSNTRAQTQPTPSATLEREIAVGADAEITIRNLRGRVEIATAAVAPDESGKIFINAFARETLAESDLISERNEGRIRIEVAGAAGAPKLMRIDLSVRVPARARVRIETTDGAIDAVGDFRRVEARTTTGTIRADVPSLDLRYNFEWSAARPRIYSLLDLAPAKEGRGGRFRVSGRFPLKEKNGEVRTAKIDADGEGATDAAATDSSDSADGEKAEDAVRTARKRAERERRVELSFTTERGVVLLGADPATVPADLRERTLTEAARLFIRGGNETLIDRVRRLAPRLVDEYAGTLTIRRSSAPTLAVRDSRLATRRAAAEQSRVVATVTDRAGRPLTNLTQADFSVRVDGVEQEVLQVTPSEAPFNLVLLLDTSGSVEERLDFIRRAALRFVSTADPQDRIAILTFRDDIERIADFTADRAELTRRINTIQAGGATALYDALAYVLLETLRALPEREQERTAIVVLSDGDDNRSFLAFQNVLDLTRETGSPFYPLYVPSGLIQTAGISSPSDTAARADATADQDAPLTSTRNPDLTRDLDPTRSRLLTLTTVATTEGARLARETGGVFYPVTRLEDLQQAYDDIVRQLRTSYTITYRAPQDTEARAVANATGEEGIRVRVRRPGAVVARTGQPTN